MRVLGLDSVSPRPALALLTEKEEGLDEDAEPLEHGAVELLVRRVTALLDRAGAAPSSLDRIAVLSGPGSFTGLRAGIAFTRGLARALDIPLVSHTTFEAACAALDEPADVSFLLDAGRGEVHQAFRSGGRLEESPRPLPRGNALEAAAERGLAVRDLAEAPLSLARAAARLALGGSGPELVVARYGRPSAAEEKLLARERS